MHSMMLFSREEYEDRLRRARELMRGGFDRDGNTDIFIEMGGAIEGDKYHNILFQNPGQGNHWLSVKLVGTKTNRCAIGVRITAKPDGFVPIGLTWRNDLGQKDPIPDTFKLTMEHGTRIGGIIQDESGKPVDASGTTANGTKVEGLAGLRALLLADPDQFPRMVTEKLMTYALGRRLEYYDRPAIRKIVRDAAASNYSWSSIMVGIAKSPTFLMRAASTASN